MEKSEWQLLYNSLEKIYSDFSIEFEKSKHGSNAKIRTMADKRSHLLIHSALNKISDYIDAYELLTGGKNISGYSRAIFEEEFKRPHYFNDDMPIFMKKISDKIKSEL